MKDDAFFNSESPLASGHRVTAQEITEQDRKFIVKSPEQGDKMTTIEDLATEELKELERNIKKN